MGCNAFLVLALAGCNGDSTAPPHQLKVSRIDSGGGKVRCLCPSRSCQRAETAGAARWTLADAGPGGILEAIGDAQSDADQISMVCTEFDAAGNLIPATRPIHTALKLMGQFWALCTGWKPSGQELLEQEQRARVVADVTLGDFSLETFQGYSAVRRYSRMRRQ